MMFRTEFYPPPFQISDFVYKIETKVYTDWDKECELLKEYLEYAIENSAIMIMHRFNETGMLIMPECYGFQNWKRHFNK